MSEFPILSICIPTYNRAEYLKKTLESIVVQKKFSSNEVEIVISDNASSDDTGDVAKLYCKKYSNIRYYRNKENVRDCNYPLVISKATGMYRKLCNDTMEFNEGALELLLSTINNHIKEKPVIFWNSGNEDIKKDTLFCTLNEAIEKISYWATSISCFGIWEEDFVYNEEGCSKSLWQVPNLFGAIEKKDKIYVCTKEFYSIQGVKNKDLSYGLYEVFYKNFLGYILEQCKKGTVTEKVFHKVKKDLLFKFFLGWVVAKRNNSSAKYSETEQFEELLVESYRNESYYKYYRLKVNYCCFVLMLKKKTKLVINKVRNLWNKK